MQTTSNTVLIDLHYLPSLAYFTYLLPYNTIRLEAHETYQKQSYRNRCYLLTPQGSACLTVPVCKSNSKMAYRTTEIDHSQAWAKTHWRSFCTAYNKAPYFEYFAEHFYTILQQQHTYLFDMNVALLQTCLQLLQLKKSIELSSTYKKRPTCNMADARYRVNLRNRLVSDISRQHPYQQVFGRTFYPNLSIIDLLFCKGREAIDILRAMSAQKQESAQ